jgi:NADPH:quinone reductase
VFDQALRCLGDGGRLLTIGYAAGEIPTVGANILLLKNIGVLGFNWGEYVGWGKTDKRQRHAARVQAALSELMAWWECGLISPTVSKTFPLDDFVLAMDAVQGRRSIGRVALVPSS